MVLILRIEGALTCGVAILGYILIPDFPEDVNWLTQEEKDWVKQRLRDDVGGSGRVAPPVGLKDLRPIYTDLRVCFPRSLTALHN